MRQTRTYRMSKAQVRLTGAPKGGLHQCLLERALQFQPQPRSTVASPHLAASRTQRVHAALSSEGQPAAQSAELKMRQQKACHQQLARSRALSTLCGRQPQLTSCLCSMQASTLMPGSCSRVADACVQRVLSSSAAGCIASPQDRSTTKERQLWPCLARLASSMEPARMPVTLATGDGAQYAV